MNAHRLADIAREYGFSCEDVVTIADVELADHSEQDYDPDTGTVSDHGRRIIVTHLQGGIDPQ